MRKEGLKHLGLYLISYAAAEFIVFGFFLIAFIDQGPEIWVFFGWLQFVMPLGAGFIWLVLEGLLYSEHVKEAQEEWNKRVEKVVEIVEKMQKEKNDENLKKNS